MLRRMLGLGVLLLPLVHLAGQDIDANVTVQNRKPSTVADQIRDPAERASFIEVARHAPPERMLNRARAFLARFPQSAFLFQAYDVVSCHMPRIMDSVLFRARTHRVDDIPNPEMTQRFGQKESPNACLLCHSEKDAHWVEQALTAWKRTPQG